MPKQYTLTGTSFNNRGGGWTHYSYGQCTAKREHLRNCGWKEQDLQCVHCDYYVTLVWRGDRGEAPSPPAANNVSEHTPEDLTNFVACGHTPETPEEVPPYGQITPAPPVEWSKDADLAFAALVDEDPAPETPIH